MVTATRDAEYVEAFWLPLVGPTGTLMLRRLLTDHGYDPLRDHADLGVQRTKAKVALQRLLAFDLVAVRDDGRIVAAVRPLTPGLLARLPGRLQAIHAMWEAA